MIVLLLLLFIATVSGRVPKCEESEYKMTDKMINYLLDQHNSKRNNLAGGFVTGLQPAAHMHTLAWDQDLALTASIGVCQKQINNEHATSSEPHVGQNIGMDTGSFFAETHFRNIIDQWWQGNKLVTPAVLRSYPPLDNTLFSNFTVMAKDTNTHVGCGAAILKPKKTRPAFILHCNYAVGNVIQQRTYEVGEGATGCKTGRNRKYKYLCSPKEAQYNRGP